MSHSLGHSLSLDCAPGPGTDVTGNPQLGVGVHLPRQHSQELSTMSERTIEFLAEVDNHSNIQGLDGDGFERNRIADTIATKVIVDTECGTVVVRMYIDGQRYAEGDYYTDDKADALATAKSIRDKAADDAVPVDAVPAQPDDIQYDYDNQAWIKNGVYQNCNHPASMARQCEASCYGRMHQGEKAPNIH
jgi:hypothetical protein